MLGPSFKRLRLARLDKHEHFQTHQHFPTVFDSLPSPIANVSDGSHYFVFSDRFTAKFLLF